MISCYIVGMNKRLLFLPVILLLALGNIFADEDDEQEFVPPPQKTGNSFINSITDKEVEAYMRSEYNRSNIFYGELSVLGGVEFFNQLEIKGGISMGRTESSTDISTFIRPSYTPFRIPLTFSAAWIYNGMPEYEAHTHSFLPYVTYGVSRAGISIGMNFRFTSFFDEEPQFESVLSFSGYINFIDTETLQIGISAGTFSDFQAKNMGAYSLKVNVLMNLDSRWSILNEVEMMQSGGDGFSTTFYGFAWRGGVRYSW